MRAVVQDAYGSADVLRLEELELLAGLVEAGRLAVVLDRTFPLADAAQAMRHLVAGSARGKVVIDVARSDDGPGRG